MNKKKSKSKLALIVSAIIFALSLAVMLVSASFSAFAEFYSRTVSGFIRFVMSFITGFIPVSIAEITVILIFPGIIAFIAFVIASAVKRKKYVKTSLCVFFTVVFVALSLFINCFGVCYMRLPLEQNLGLDRKPLSREELYLTTEFIKNELEKNLDAVEFADSGMSKNPHEWNELSRLIDNGFDKLADEYGFVSKIVARPKKIFLSPIMTYTHISGVYFPFTGEANVNTNYPNYVVCYTVAHEKAHQRGVASEDEANFAAFLACLNSGNDYLIYCALLSMYDYFLDAEYEHDKEMYYYFLNNTEPRVLGEMRAYSEFFDKYRNSAASKVAGSVNDTYIKTMGDSEGVKSYGNVIELFAAYIQKNNGLDY